MKRNKERGARELDRQSGIDGEGKLAPKRKIKNNKSISLYHVKLMNEFGTTSGRVGWMGARNEGSRGNRMCCGVLGEMVRCWKTKKENALYFFFFCYSLNVIDCKQILGRKGCPLLPASFSRFFFFLFPHLFHF